LLRRSTLERLLAELLDHLHALAATAERDRGCHA
jgi:hypothetical protein